MLIAKELRQVLEKDVVERVVSTRLRRLAMERKAMQQVNQRTRVEEGGKVQQFEGMSLKGLSFRKANKRAREEAQAQAQAQAQALVEKEKEEKAVVEDEDEAMARPKKKRKKEQPKRVVEEDIESEDEEGGVVVERKREASDEQEDERARKRAKVDEDEVPVEVVSSKKKKAVKKGARLVKPAASEEPFDQIVYPTDLDFATPPLAQLIPDLASISPPSTPLLKPKRDTQPSPPPDPYAQGICSDDEDLFFTRLALAEDMGQDISSLAALSPPLPDPDSPPPFRVHQSGSARTEGYYKISHAEKSAYVAQYATRTATADVVEEKPKTTMTSSRSNRANARRQAQGLEEINQVQRAMALSKGENAAAELTIKFNQLQSRKKHLRFARSPIHDWGLYAMERIARGELVIEYVGEVVRAQVADKREKAYERQGIGSSYLFRIDEDLVVDATKKGNLGCVALSFSCWVGLMVWGRRLINHSCDPNCTAKIITINGEKKIVIYAKQDIELGDEITYGAFHSPSS